MNQTNAPLYNTLKQFSDLDRVSFHVPGHKNGQVFNKVGQGCFRTLLNLDVTELSGLDDLHHPTSVIKDAQILTAKLYGVQESFFLVGGSTVGNLTMIMAACNENDQVIVQRNSHKSIINALRLAKVNPIFIAPLVDHEAMVATQVIEEELLNAIEVYTEAKAIILTNPNYYGHAINLDMIIKKAHEYNMAVLVDEAHGSHFSVCEKHFPRSSIKSGADIVIHSAHKTLPAMTMGSFLHYNSKIISLEKIKQFLQVFQTSSPSYPIMASLDLARHYLASLNETEIEKIIISAKKFVNQLSVIPQLKVLNRIINTDPLKVTVQSRCKLSGFQLQKLFEKEGIFTELADLNNVLFVLPLARFDVENTVAKIKKCLENQSVVDRTLTYIKGNDTSSSKLAISYREMEEAEIETLTMINCIERICAEDIIPYPPGVPLLYSGEIITSSHIQNLVALKEAGAYFQGEQNFLVRGIKVYKR